MASPLQREGYNVRIFDMHIEDLNNFKIGNPVFVGISCMSSFQICYGLEFASKMTDTERSCPIVRGGAHPTLLLEQTISSGLVSVVVRCEGESAIVKLADALTKKQSLLTSRREKSKTILKVS
ncbi:MAG: anaerobic magnesium-protoporphyrin monomethyl ester cyclase [Thermoproteota archaeon]|nr:anaerobic magnesium-protoporphyrin monomethyl ester cyclase [Thermoproteota archaeon]